MLKKRLMLTFLQKIGVWKKHEKVQLPLKQSTSGAHKHSSSSEWQLHILPLTKKKRSALNHLPNSILEVCYKQSCADFFGDVPEIKLTQNKKDTLQLKYESCKLPGI